MASIKKRKRDISSEKPSLSAFAARRALKSDISSPKRANRAAEDIISSDLDKEATPEGPKSKDHRILDNDKVVVKGRPEDGGVDLGTRENLSGFKDNQASSFESRVKDAEVPIHRPFIALSTYKPSKENFKELADGVISLRIAPGERLVLLGQCDISITQGEITLLGAILRPSQKLYRLYASSSHSLPVIRCSVNDMNHAEILIHQCEGGLTSLQNLSPLYRRLWNDRSTCVGSNYSNLLRTPKPSTFQILFSSNDSPERAYLQPLTSPPEWNVVLAELSKPSNSERKPKVIFICGPKSSGKSTFAKLLGNRLVSSTRDFSGQGQTVNTNGIVVLDLDPGQPEYSVPGQLALIYIQEPNFGLPFSHPVLEAPNKLIRSHSICAMTPALDPSLYTACALDLFAHYHNLKSVDPNCPLIINTPGWVLGTGLEILVELIEKICPSEIIYMSRDGPPEVTESLKDAAKSISIITLPSQISEYTTRTAAHLRTMQYMSYFHLSTMYKEKLAWNCDALMTIPPWEISYSGEYSGIFGIICYGEQPVATLLAETINGSLVSVVVIDDISAIPGWDSKSMECVQPNSEEVMTKNDELEDIALDNEPLNPRRLLTPLIIRTPDENLPYFNPENAVCLNPSKSYSIGLALIRGIDAARQRIQVLTPIDRRVIEDVRLAGKMIVLVSGKLDTPGWAYTEQIQKYSTKEKNAPSRDNNYMAIDEETDTVNIDESELEEIPIELTECESHLQGVPWVQELEGSQGRGVGSRVWRIRRDLGKFNDGVD